VWLAAVEEAEAVRLPVLDEKGQWKGMDDKVPVPDEVGPGPWKGDDDG
jgi:hypothetical protein